MTKTEDFGDVVGKAVESIVLDVLYFRRSRVSESARGNACLSWFKRNRLVKRAAATISLLPVVVFFFIIQRYFVEGTAGGVKQ